MVFMLSQEFRAIKVKRIVGKGNFPILRTLTAPSFVLLSHVCLLRLSLLIKALLIVVCLRALIEKCFFSSLTIISDLP